MADIVNEGMPKVPVVMLVFDGVGTRVCNMYGPYDWTSNESMTRMHDHARVLREQGFTVECGWDLIPPCELDVGVTSNTRGVA